jgi:hypothetical protein
MKVITKTSKLSLEERGLPKQRDDKALDRQNRTSCSSSWLEALQRGSIGGTVLCANKHRNLVSWRY